MARRNGRAGAGGDGEARAALAARVASLGTWFHNLRLPVNGAADPSTWDCVETAADHPLGDFPATFWQFFEHVVPASLAGKSVLDIGCNAGFYSFEMKRRGAARVLGIDHDPAYLAQAALAREQLGLDVEFRQLEAYDVDTLGEQFDLVLFMGVFYHLRHPLYALERVAGITRGHLLFQTMERGACDEVELAADYSIDERDIFFDKRFPRMYFVEHAYAGDKTNWWIPNRPATMAMLRSTGLRIVAEPCHEVYLCERPQPHALV